MFVLGRVSVKHFRANAAALIGELSPEAACVGSNVYSVPESVLLMWLTLLYCKEFPGTYCSALCTGALLRYRL